MTVNLTTIDQIIADVDMIAKVAAMFPPATLPATVADKILQVAMSAIAAHVAATGKPFDPALLAPVAPA